MTDTKVASAPVAEKIVAKSDFPKKSVKAKKPAAKPTHPTAGEMIIAAVTFLAERQGSSLQAIKKYIAANFKVDVEKQALYIKKFLKSAVEKGTLIQTKGKGASGSFKLSVTKTASKPKATAASGEKKKPVTPKKAAAKKPAAKKTPGEPKSPVKKATGPKKAVAKKPVSPKKPTAKSKAAAAPKAKKATKAPTAKPKAPKPKKVTATRTVKSTAKKAAAKK